MVPENHGKNYAISLVRCLAMISIITCHALQYYNNPLATWANVGVQIFLFMSGYLYGRRDIVEIVPFYKRTFLKILSSYWIVVFIFGLIHTFWLNTIDKYVFVKLFVVGCWLPGGEHLWFVKAILYCYLFTIFLNKYFDTKMSLPQKIVRFIILIPFILIFVPDWLVVHIITYILGFCVGKCDKKQYEIVFLILIVLALVTNILRFIHEFVHPLSIPNYSVFTGWAHIFLGSSLFMISLKVFAHMGAHKVLDFTDKYSYEIYLVHQFFILGPLSLMAFSDYLVVNLLLIVFVTVLLGILVKKISDLIRRGFAQMWKKGYTAKL